MKDVIAAKEMRNLMALDFFLKWWNKRKYEEKLQFTHALTEGASEGILAHLREQQEE